MLDIAILGSNSAEYLSILEAKIRDKGHNPQFIAEDTNFKSFNKDMDLYLIPYQTFEDNSDLREFLQNKKWIATTFSPTWRRARKALKFGAFDYIRAGYNMWDDVKSIINRL